MERRRNVGLALRTLGKGCRRQRHTTLLEALRHERLSGQDRLGGEGRRGGFAARLYRSRYAGCATALPALARAAYQAGARGAHAVGQRTLRVAVRFEANAGPVPLRETGPFCRFDYGHFVLDGILSNPVIFLFKQQCSC